MSIEAMNWAWKQPVPNSSAKFVLLAIANRANPDQQGRIVAFTSIAYLADVTAQDRKTIVTNVSRLLEWALISDTGERVGKTRQVPVYQVNCPPDLFTETAGERYRKRNRTENGTVPKKSPNGPVFPAEQSRKRDTDSLLIPTDSKAKAGMNAQAKPKPGEPSGRLPPASEVLAKSRAKRPASHETAAAALAAIEMELRP